MEGVPPFTLSEYVTRGERSFFEEHGFIVYEGVLHPDQVESLRADAAAYAERISAGEIADRNVDPLAPTTHGVDGAVALHHRLSYFTLNNERSREVLTAQEILAIGTGLGAPSSWLLEDTMHGVVYQTKSGGSRSSYSSIRWHLDFPVRHVLSPVVTVGVYVDPSLRGDGCLAVIPGSHRYPVGRFSPPSVFIEAMPGDIVCHHYRLFHGSGPMQDERSRRATVYLYFCGGEYPGPGLPPFNEVTALEGAQSLFRAGNGDA